jgi:hypothetical protein
MQVNTYMKSQPDMTVCEDRAHDWDGTIVQYLTPVWPHIVSKHCETERHCDTFGTYSEQADSEWGVRGVV